MALMFNINNPTYQYTNSNCEDDLMAVLSTQWEFLYWWDNIFILNQRPDWTVNVMAAYYLAIEGAKALAAIILDLLSQNIQLQEQES